MKPCVCFISVLLLLLAPFLSSAQYHYIIEGKFDNSLLGDAHPFSFKDGDSVKLYFINSKQQYATTVKDHCFRFEGTIDTPSVAMLDMKKFGVKVHLDNSKYNCTFPQEKVGNNKVGYDFNIETASFFHNLHKTLFQKSGALEAKQRELKELIENSDDSYTKNTYKEELEVIEKDLSALFLDASVKYKGTYEMTYLLNGDPYFSYDRYIHYYNELPDQVRNSFYGKLLYNKLQAQKKQ
ncbi:DUF4369 domain-containing protein [Chitinophaga solisilvae]|uniref:DUF4369 domain-containing protein n=1 Tax=Chitinophaga solisilvae TaxID=1233460 RepID=UPI00136ED214|nr:DUF4369 domain-containing protein [Chitinophaga solisilvae]